jgi:hypothetical protein
MITNATGKSGPMIFSNMFACLLFYSAIWRLMPCDVRDWPAWIAYKWMR